MPRPINSRIDEICAPIDALSRDDPRLPSRVVVAVTKLLRLIAFEEAAMGSEERRLAMVGLELLGVLPEELRTER